MKNVIVLAMAFLVVACSTTKVKTNPDFTWTDRSSRLLIDPNGVPAEHYAMIQDALIKSDRFVVIDRPQDLDTIQREQNNTDPDVVKSRWLEWSKKYDIGGVVTAHAQCFTKGSEKFCHQFLAINNTETGELVAQAEAENSAQTAVSYEYIVPDWDGIAAQLVKEFNKNHTKMEARRVASLQQKQEPSPTPKPEIVKQPEAKVEAPMTPAAVETPKAPAVSEAPKAKVEEAVSKEKPVEAKPVESKDIKTETKAVETPVVKAPEVAQVKEGK